MSHLPQFTLPTNHDRPAWYRSAAQAHHDQRTTSILPSGRKYPVVLLVGDPLLLVHLQSLLAEHDYHVYMATDVTVACKLLGEILVDLVLFHVTTMDATLWEGYNQLRQATPNTLVILSNITANHFDPNQATLPAQKVKADLNNYLQALNLLYFTLVDNTQSARVQKHLLHNGLIGGDLGQERMA
jgi:response regulator RpfG family c-di-GMP phosphodiesterase